MTALFLQNKIQKEGKTHRESTDIDKNNIIQ